MVDGSHSAASNIVKPASLNLSERPFPGYLIDQVGRQISQSFLKGNKSIQLQLRPPELGALKIEMDMQSSGLKLAIVAENSSVKDMLMSSIPQLRESLIEQGIRLERLDVQINENFDQSLANLKDGADRDSR